MLVPAAACFGKRVPGSTQRSGDLCQALAVAAPRVWQRSNEASPGAEPTEVPTDAAVHDRPRLPHMPERVEIALTSTRRSPARLDGSWARSDERAVHPRGETVGKFFVRVSAGVASR
jgi:hypothetical protein